MSILSNRKLRGNRLIIASILGILALSACKPSMQSYHAAYESAVARRDSMEGIDNTIYNRYREMAVTGATDVAGDTLQFVTEYIGYTADGGASRETTLRYNIVVGKFKQVFNARQMRERLQSIGYENPFILHTREPLYYVVAETQSTAIEALNALKRVKADTNLHLREPLPFVLQPAHMAR